MIICTEFVQTYAFGIAKNACLHCGRTKEIHSLEVTEPMEPPIVKPMVVTMPLVKDKEAKEPVIMTKSKFLYECAKIARLNHCEELAGYIIKFAASSSDTEKDNLINTLKDIYVFLFFNSIKK